MTGDRPSLISKIIGNQGALEEWRAAGASERLHHAWLLQGPRGVGKAHAALLMAGGLLGVPDGNTEGSVAQLIHAGSHPDLRIVNVPVDDKGKAKSEIPVDSIRELSRFFMMRPALGGWRIGVIDSVGELNRNGANALLKTLEEPPSQCVLILVAHDERYFETLLAPLPLVQRTRMREAWPGPVTFVVPDPDGWSPEWVRGSHDSVAVRVSRHPLTCELSRLVKGPLISTSANPAGAAPALTALQARRYFGDELDLYLAGATGGETRPSRIIDALTGKTFRE